jgi:6-phosphogluconolactonase
MQTQRMPSIKPEIRIVANTEELARAAAEEFVRLAKEAVSAKDSFNVVLSGGSTPKSLYSLLANERALRGQVPWDKIHFFWGDERHVPPDHAESNYRMANEAMLSKAPIQAENVHRIKGENPDAGKAADEYDRALRDFFRLSDGQFPGFDLAFLGLGPDGHTASLFPGTKALHEQRRLAVSNWVGKFYTDRITLTAPVFNNAACVIFHVGGSDKALPLKAVLEGKYEPEQLPAQLIRPERGRLLWIADRAAASSLQGSLESK